MSFRIGNGYDVHKLVENRKLILGGVEIPYEFGLLGHSDADVLLHAICDAILGASGNGDIGKHFPDNDPKYLGISSIKLLENVCQLVNKQGFKICNIDSIVVLQKPKLAPFIEQMKENIAAACKIELSCVNVKATTEENLGFTGSGEGCKSYAVCLLDKSN